MEDMLLELYNTLKTTVKPHKVLIHMLQKISNAKLKLESIRHTVMLNLVDAHKYNTKFKETQWL
jgi:hypothetical protein